MRIKQSHKKPDTHRTAQQGDSTASNSTHDEQHLRWSRRHFLQMFGTAAIGSGFLFNQTAMAGIGHSPLLNALRHSNTDRVLVLLKLDGGNDGLNTVIPIANDTYYNSRSTLAIAGSDTLIINEERGFNSALADIMPLYAEGKVAVVEGVGYPNPSLSHLRSSDIWLSGSDSNTVVNNGWTGRTLEEIFPDYSDTDSSFPLGVQIGGSSLLFNGVDKRTGMSIASPDAFNRLAGQGVAFDFDGIPETTYGSEMRYAREIINESYRFAPAVLNAAGLGSNQVAYPETALAADLAVAARLIKGEFGARVYVVSLGGFDTHAQQEPTHSQLLATVAGAVKAFIDDLEAAQVMDRVLLMTCSEFGRSTAENGSFGTEHGTAAPVFLFGNDFQGGLHGTHPNLNQTDAAGNPIFTVDFRAVYQHVLQGWFQLTPDVAESILGDTYPILDIFSNLPVSNESPADLGSFSLSQNYPNPAAGRTTIGYELPQATPVQLEVFDIQGRRVFTLVDGMQTAGKYEVPVSTEELPAGRYLYKLQTNRGEQSKIMSVIR